MTRQEQAHSVIEIFSEIMSYAVEQTDGGSVYHERLQAIAVEHLSRVAGQIVGSAQLHEILGGGESPLGSPDDSSEHKAMLFATWQMGTFLEQVAGT